MSQELSGPRDYATFVDLQRYPIHDLSTAAGRALVRSCREELQESGACSLPGFLNAAAVDVMIEIAEALADVAWVSDQSHTVYFEPPDESARPDDPRALLVRSAKRGIAYDYLPADSPIRVLYESDDMTDFVASVLDKKCLYRSADPLDAAQVTLFAEGDELGWHFDRSEFSVTLMYRPALAGGDFEYFPAIRSDDNPRYGAVREVLVNGSSGASLLPTDPGTLSLFHGHHALHRVSAIQGARSRINSVLTYGEHRGMRLNDLTSQLFYGRTSGDRDAGREPIGDGRT